METVLRNFGNSVGLVIPKQVREALHMQAGQTVQLETSAQGLLIRPAHKYTLDALLAQCDASAPHRRINSPPGMTRHRLDARCGKRPSF